MSSMKSFQKQAAKVQTDALVDPDAVEIEEGSKHAAHQNAHAPQSQPKGHLQSSKGGQKSTGRKKV